MRWRELKPPPPLGAAEAQRLRAVCGLLARPRFGSAHFASLTSLMEEAGWAPLPMLPSLNLLVPMFREHLRPHGVELEEILWPDARQAHPPPPRDLAFAWFHRKQLLGDVLAQAAQSGIDRIVLIKGAALASHYESPPLRQMADADLIVAAEQLPLLSSALRDMGLEETRDDLGHVFRHQSGFLFDVKTGTDSITRACLAESAPHTAFAETPACEPPPWLHLILVSMHATGGIRLWRDVADAHTILGIGETCATAARALEQAPAHLYPPVAAMLRFLNECSPASTRLPPALPGREAQEPLVRELLHYYRLISVERLPSVAINLMRGVYSKFVARRPRASTPGTASARGAWAEQDPALGVLPAPGSAARQFLRAGVMAGMLLSPARHRYRRLLAVQESISQHRWKIGKSG